MFARAILPILAAVTLSVPALAQDAGGVRLAPGLNGGPVGLARALPFVRQPLITARDLQNGMSATDHQAQNQAMITRLRGDAGYLAGFSFGTPLAASRQVALPVDNSGYDAYGGSGGHDRYGHGQRPIIINNEGPLAVTVGNNNVVQQQTATGSGPIAQQQVATVGSSSSGGGAVNVVTGGGNILQRAPR